MKTIYEDNVIKINNLIENSPIKWKYMLNKTILFDNGIALKILSYDAKKQKLTFQYLNNVATVSTDYFIIFNESKIKEYFKNLLFLYEIGDTICDKNRNLVVIDRFKINKKKFYKVKCNVCGYCTVVDEYALKNHNYSCSCCNGNVVVEGVNDIPTTDPWMVDYFQCGYEEAKLYTHGSSAELYFICPHCHRIHDRAIAVSTLYARKQLNCLCMDHISYPEKFMRNFLQINNIDYTYQAGNNIFSWCKNYLYDFYIPDKKIIIETHGDQHYNTAFKRISLDEQKLIDEEKRSLAESNGFVYVVVDCRNSNAKYIYEQIKISNLDSLLNISISNLDLTEIDKKCRTNLLKEICCYYNDNGFKPKEIADKYKLNITTINKYLHIGTELGWCIYDPIKNLKEGQQKTAEIMTNKKRKLCGDIAVYDENGKLIGKFLNQYDAKDKLSNIGIDISVSSIGQALKRDTHKSKGLYFYYTKNIEMEGC